MRVVKTLKELEPSRRIVSHYRKFCADDGKKAEAILSSHSGEYCVNCPSELNEAGKKIMRRADGPQ